MTQFGMTVKRFQKGFFDFEKVMSAAERANKRAKARGGGLVRTIARRSIRKRKKSSSAGAAPSGHTDKLKRLIFFAEDATTGGVVIGPAEITTKPSEDIIQTQKATEILEKGGKIRVREIYNRGQWTRRSLVKNRRGKRTRTRTVRIKPRPYMGPALEKAKPQLSQFWENSIRG